MMSHIPVLIVGAGPVGVATALLLDRFAIPCVVIDRNYNDDRPSGTARHDGIVPTIGHRATHPRSQTTGRLRARCYRACARSPLLRSNEKRCCPTA